jgi:hypothetical protein
MKLRKRTLLKLFEAVLELCGHDEDLRGVAEAIEMYLAEQTDPAFHDVERETG